MKKMMIAVGFAALAFFMLPLNSLTVGGRMWNVLGVILGTPGTSVDIL
ncbi:MAG: hypothetical protein J6W80_06910 [Kiritimatiellae bacterium]|nr:hypothetical protein [Kiritimatiellia bacterium]